MTSLFLLRDRTSLSKKVQFTICSNYSTSSFNNIDPNYITGFIDGEGCFNISIIKNSNSSVGYHVHSRVYVLLKVHSQ